MKLDSASHVIVTLGEQSIGKRLIVLCGLHGNEPAGRNAILRCVQVLMGREIPLKGEVVFLEGNLGASTISSRYIKRDLNRLWTEEYLAKLAQLPLEELEEEDIEQLELFSILKEYLDSKKCELFLDLHTTSGESPPFIPYLSPYPDDGREDTAQNVSSALGLPQFSSGPHPIDGLLAHYIAERGISSIVIEGGQNDDETSAEYLASVIWISLFKLEILETKIPEVILAEQQLQKVAKGLPRLVEPIYRHQISPADTFRMLPNFANFQPVTRGEHLADDKDGPVNSPFDGLLLFPLYQPYGDEGFLIVEADGSIF